MMAETILVVDDEEPVRKTFREWLAGADLDCEVLAAADAAAALNHANQRTIDLAILDWNLGAGNNGLQLLEDLFVFNPDVVAILITGYAQQATPLDAMRMGVRDYLDKNQHLNRETFLATVRRQLERIRPAKRERQLQWSLAQFRDSVERLLPLIRAAAAVNDPVPFSESVRGLFRFLLRSTNAADGVLVVRGYHADRQPAETYRAYRMDGVAVSGELVPFAQSLAGAVLSAQETSIMADPAPRSSEGGFQRQPFEQGRKSVLAAPLLVAPGLSAVLELFDKPGGFGEADRRLVGATAEFAAELIRHALAQRETHGVLFAAVEEALEASLAVRDTLETAKGKVDLPAPVLDKVKEALRQRAVGVLDADQSLRVAEVLRDLALRHGPEATAHCLRLLENVRQLLDSATGC